jgi:hypothetical protein
MSRNVTGFLNIVKGTTMQKMLITILLLCVSSIIYGSEEVDLKKQAQILARSTCDLSRAVPTPKGIHSVPLWQRFTYNLAAIGGTCLIASAYCPALLSIVIWGSTAKYVMGSGLLLTSVITTFMASEDRLNAFEDAPTVGTSVTSSSQSKRNFPSILKLDSFSYDGAHIMHHVGGTVLKTLAVLGFIGVAKILNSYPYPMSVPVLNT